MGIISRENHSMTHTLRIRSAIVIAFLLASGPAWAAADGAALYKSRCSNCHGANGEGKPAMKTPPLKGTAMSAEDVQALLTTGVSGKKGPHGKAMSGLKAEQAKAIADYVKSL
jgi:mono/diheme cytochrome c family protein